MDNENIQNQTEIEQFISSYKKLNILWCGLVSVVDALVPIMMYIFIALVSIVAYANTVNGVNAIIPNPVIGCITFGVVWLPIRAAYKAIKYGV